MAVACTRRLEHFTSLAVSPKINGPDAYDFVSSGEVEAIEQVDGRITMRSGKLQDGPDRGERGIARARDLSILVAEPVVLDPRIV